MHPLLRLMLRYGLPCAFLFVYSHLFLFRFLLLFFLPTAELMSELDFVRIGLKDIVYTNPGVPGTRPDSIRVTALSPDAVHPWTTFFASVLNMQLGNQPQYPHPSFYASRTVSCENDLHGVFRMDIGSVACLWPFARTNASGVFRRGFPDLSCSYLAMVNGTLFPAEIKSVDILHVPDGNTLGKRLPTPAVALGWPCSSAQTNLWIHEV